MTIEEVMDRVAAIRRASGDPEVAHGMEDDLWADVLTAIAAGDCDDSEMCAMAALSTRNIDFPRWCA